MSLNSLLVYKSNYPKIRIGSRNDGGYIIADGQEYDCLISCGIANDVTFEKKFLEIYDVPAYAFDGTIDKLPEQVFGLQFIKKNISYFNSDKTTNLIDVISQYNNIFLKMDIETFEFRWIQILTTQLINKIKQIVIEFHFPFTEPGFTHLDKPLPPNEKISVLEKLAQTHTLIHLHGNNCCGVTNYKGITVPNVFECTYLRKDIQPAQLRSTDPIPSPLDKPNVPGPDIQLTGYPFTV